MTFIRSGLRSAAILFCALGALPATSAAQQTITTSVGDREIIAVAVDPVSGAVYFATDRPGAIYRAVPGSTPVLIAGVAGGPTGNGVQASQAAVFPGRNGLAVDTSGNLYFSEPALHRIRQMSPTGVVNTIAGGGGGSRINPRFVSGNSAIFTDIPAPGALAFNPVTGDLLVADETWDVVYQIVAGGSTISGSSPLVLAVGGDGSNTSIYVEFQFFNPFGYEGDGGPAKDAKLNHPRGLAFDSTGDLYIADTGNNVIRRVDAGSQTITTFAGTSLPGFSGDGLTALAAQLFMPTGLAFDSHGNLIVADTSNHAVRLIAAADGSITTIAGTPGTAGHDGDGLAGTAATLAYPTGVAVNPAGDVLIVDSQNNRVRSVSGQTMATIAQNGPDYTGDGQPGGDAVNRPLYIAFDSQGNMFFSDSANARVRRVDASHHVTTVAGNGIPGYDGDGDVAIAARLNCPAGLAFGPGGELYVADPCAQVVRRISTGDDEDGLITGAGDPGETITTVAGNGLGDGFAGPDGGFAPTVSLWNPVTVAVNSTGVIFIGEPDLSTIRTVATDQTLGTYSNDADSRGLVIDSQDHVIVGDDSESDTIFCDASGIVDSNLFNLRFASWAGLSLDGLRRLFVTEGQTQSIYQVTDSGGGTLCGGQSLVAARIAGDGAGSTGYSGDGADASIALLNHPTGTGFDGHQTLYIADTGNNVIRRVQQSVVGVQTNVSSLDFGTGGLLVQTTAKTIIVTSIGTSAATFAPSTLTGANPGDFVITADGCKGQSLSTGQSCQVQVAFKATDVGPRSATLQINDNAPGTPQTVFLSGVGTSLTVTPDSLSFPDQALLFPSAPMTVSVTNTTPSPVTIGPLSFVNSSDFSISSDLCTNHVLLSQTSCTFGVVFTPHNLGPSATTLNLGSTAGDSPRQVNVGGNGIPTAPKASLAPTTISYGSLLVGTTSPSQSVVLTNVGTAPLSVATVTLAGDQPQDFGITSDACTGATLTPLQTCTVQVQFAPQETCVSNAALTFTDNAADSPQQVGLSGTGVTKPSSIFQAASVCLPHGAGAQYLAAGMDGEVWVAQWGSRFATPAIDEVTAVAGLTSQSTDLLRSGGYKPFELTTAPDGSYAFGQFVGGGLQSYVSLVNTANAKIDSPNGFIGPITVGPEGGFWVASQFSCGNDLPLITVFAPDGTTTTYTPTPQWIFSHTGHFCIQTSTIATASDGTVWLGTTNDSTGAVGGTRSGVIRVTPDGTFVDFLPMNVPPAAFAAGLDGNMYALVGSANACQLARIDANGNVSNIAMPPSVSLTCAGSGDQGNFGEGADGRLWMYGLVFTGTQFEPTMIAFDPLVDPLQDPTKHPVSSYPMPQFAFPTAIFQTLALTAGPDEGIWFVGPSSTLVRFDIGGGPSRAFINPRVVSMPFTSLGVSSKARTIYVRSTGTAPLTVSGVTLSGPDAPQFIMSDHCSGKSLDPGQFCTIQVASRPTKAGSHRATLNVISNDGFSPQRVQLAEFALPPGPTLDPSSIAFPSTLVGKPGKIVQFILTNPADRAIAIDSVDVTGVNAGDFVQTSNQCGTTLPAGGTCTIAVQFTPSAAGTRRASLVVTDSAVPSTVSALLTGTGQSQSGGGTTPPDATCDCATGLFVDPAVVAPSVKFVSALTGASPNGVYTLTVRENGPNGGPASLTVSKGSTTLLTFTSPADATWPTTVPAWGFSPDDDRFTVHYVTNHHDTIDLFDLTGTTPNTHVWEGSALVSSDGTGTIATGSVGFSPHGDYIVATQIESFVGVGVAPSQTAFMNLVSSKGVVVGGRDIEWQLASPPTDQEKEVESAHWGFAPDDQSFVFIHDELVDGPVVDLYALPSGVKLKELTNHDGVAKYVQFGPCGEVLAVVETTTAPNPLTITLYSTRGSNAGQALAPTQADLKAVPVVLMATTSKYTAHLAGFATPLVLATNSSAAGCADPTVSGDAGGSSADTVPQFTSKSPIGSTIQGVPYTYTFHAVGSPAPTYSLDAFAPSWLSIDADTGELSGTPPITNAPGTFTFTVTATNRASFDTAGPFTVNLIPPPGPGGGGGGGVSGPLVLEGEVAFRAMEGAPAASVADATPTATTIILPNGRGQINLAADVTPALSTFTYSETDGPTELGSLVFAGLDFTLIAVDAQSGGSVGPLIDAPRATFVLRGAELRTARIRDYSRLGLYWWNGTAWINQLPCAGCGVSADGATFTALLSQVGEYVLAAVPLPSAVFSIAAQTIHVTAGDVFAGTIATFPPALPLDIAGDYAAIVDWGDGQVSPGTVSASGGAFVVAGSHSWTAAGNYSVSLTIFDGGDSGTAQSTAIVSPVAQPPAFTAAAPPLTATAGSLYSYSFAATGVPAPSFALAAGAPAWLVIGATTGLVTGTPPSGTASFAYSVIASNGISPDAVAGPFTVTVASTTRPSADLSIAMTGPATARQGSTVTYTVVVTNHGPSAALDGSVVLLAGPGASLTSATPRASVSILGLVTWCFSQLDAGASQTFVVNLKLAKDGTVAVVGAVGASTRDPNLVNNVAVTETKVK